MEQYMEHCKNIRWTKRQNVVKSVLDKHSLFCYAGYQHKPKGNSQVAMALLQMTVPKQSLEVLNF